MTPTLTGGRLRLLSLPALCLLAVMLGGADGCGGNPDLAGARQAVGVNDYDRALVNVNTVLAADPANLEALTLKADILRQQVGRAPDAAAKAALVTEMNATVRQAIAINATDSDVSVVRTNAWALSVNEGNTLLRDPAAPEGASVPLFNAAVEFMPDSSQGYFGLGLAELTRGNSVEAIASLRSATRLSPNDESAVYYLGRALLAADQGAEAITVLSAATQRFPANAALRADLLNAYARTGRAGEALSLYEAALVSPSAEEEPTLRFNYGTVLLQAGRQADAIAQFERSIALRPDNFDAQYNLGAAYQNQAADVNARANATDDNAENRRLVTERDVLLNRSLPYFERARALGAEPADGRSSCEALFRVYTTLGRIDDARGVATCAGQTMN